MRNNLSSKIGEKKKLKFRVEKLPAVTRDEPSSKTPKVGVASSQYDIKFKQPLGLVQRRQERKKNKELEK